MHMDREIYQFLDDNGIPYQRHDHLPVYTFEEANRLVPDLDAAHTKNVFLRDKKGKRHFMVMVADGRRIDLEALGDQLGVKRLNLASPERLLRYLGVDPGSVSPLAVINDSEQHVEVLFDLRLDTEPVFQCHPLVNTSTLVLTREALLQFLKACGHSPVWLDIPFHTA